MSSSTQALTLRYFFQLAAVNILSNLMVPLAGLVDVAFLGHLAEIRHLAGVALATVLFNYIYWTFGFLRMGTTGMTAQAIGRGEEETAVLIGLRHAAIALLLGLAILVLQQPLQWIGFALLSATTEVKHSGQAYYNAQVWGAPATLLNFVVIGWFLGRGQSNQVLLLSIVSNGSKVLLDYELIVRLGWQSLGAGLATAISQYLMLIVGVILVSHQVNLQQAKNLVTKLYDPAALKAVFALNREILIRTFVLISTFAAFTNLSSALGTVTLATNTVLLEVVTLAAYFIDGLAFATESIAGMLRGRNAIAQLTRLIQVSGAISLSLGLAFAAIFNLMPASLLRLLTNHTNILENAEIYVLWLVPVLGFGSIAYMLDGYFLGLTEGKILRWSTVIAAMVGFAPCAIVAWYFRSSHLLWLSLSAFMVMRALTLGTQVPKTLREL